MEQIIKIWKNVDWLAAWGGCSTMHVLGGLTDVLVEVKSCAELTGGGSVT